MNESPKRGRKGTRRPGPVGLELAAIIRERMGRLRKNQADLVRETGIGQTTMSRILSGTKIIEIDELVTIARTLNEDPGELLDTATSAVSRNQTSQVD